MGYGLPGMMVRVEGLKSFILDYMVKNMNGVPMYMNLGGGVSTYHVKLSTYGAGQSSFEVMLTLNKFLDLGDATIQCQKTKYQNLGVRGPNETSIEFKS